MENRTKVSKVKEILEELILKAKLRDGKVSYAEIGLHIENFQLFKTDVEELNSLLIEQGIKVEDSETPDDLELCEIETTSIEPMVDEIDEDDDEEIDIKKDLDLDNIPKSVSVDDPVRMYLKEIGTGAEIGRASCRERV